MLASPIFLTVFVFFFLVPYAKSTESGNFIWNAEVKGELPKSARLSITNKTEMTS